MPEFDGLLVGDQAVSAARAGDRDAIFRAVVHKSLAGIPSADGALIQVREDDELVLRAAVGDAPDPVGQRQALDRSFAGRSIRAGRAMMWDDIEGDEGIDLNRYRAAGIRSIISVPIVHHDAPMGAIKFVARRPGAFEGKDLTIAKLIAGQIAAALAIVAEQVATDARRPGEERFQAITEALPQLVWTMSPGGRVRYCNRRTLDFLAVSGAHDLQEDPLSFIVPEDRERVASIWEGAERLPAPFDVECRVLPRRGQAQWMQLSLVPLHDDAGALTSWVGAGVNVDTFKRMEIELKETVRTRDLLLQEVNHRVKNSLQIAVGLLALQASKIANVEARQRLLEAREQISTIAKVHQFIYRTVRHDHVEFGALLQSLVSGLVGHGALQRAELLFDLPEELVLPLDRGVPVALIVAEVVTNALKHGQPDDLPARIEVAVQKESTGITLDISDNGPGLPEDFMPETSQGLGMEIIFGLTAQAGGRIEIVPAASGAHFRLFLPFQ